MKKLILIFITFLLMTNIMIVISFGTEETKEEAPAQEEVAVEVPAEPTIEVTKAKAKVLRASEVKDKEYDDYTDKYQNITIKIINGKYKDKEIETEYTLSYDVRGQILAYKVDEGDVIDIEIVDDGTDNILVTIEGFHRMVPIIVIGVLFVIAMLAIYRLKGLRILLAIAFELLALYFFMIKGIYKGGNIFWRVFFVGAVSTFISMLIIDGNNKKSFIASISGIIGAFIGTGIASIFNHYAKISGAVDEAIQYSAHMSVTYDFRALLIVEVTFVILGICLSVAKMIAGRLDDEKKKRSDIPKKELFFKGIERGKDILGSSFMTIGFFYIGTLTSMMLIYLACAQHLLTILNREFVAEATIIFFSGGFGILATIAITSLIYAFWDDEKFFYKNKSDNKVDGKRSLKV